VSKRCEIDTMPACTLKITFQILLGEIHLLTMVDD
jgi:hypothetical protein